jgi:hypothetical protein
MIGNTGTLDLSAYATISYVDNEIESLETVVSGNTQLIATLQGNVGDIDGNITTITSNISSIEDNLSNMQSQIDAKAGIDTTQGATNFLSGDGTYKKVIVDTVSTTTAYSSDKTDKRYSSYKAVSFGGGTTFQTFYRSETTGLLTCNVEIDG